MSNVIYKMFQTKATSIDEANFNITFKVSDSSVDRQGEIVSQKDWQMDNYMANPVLLFGHDPSKPSFVLGKCLQMEYNAAEDCHYGTYHLDADFNTDARLVWNQLVAGTIRTVSLGFISHNLEYDDDIAVLSGVEPLETSIVPIPANAGALAKAYKAGKLNEKDARYLIKTMQDETARIEAELEAAEPTTKEKSMSPEQAQAVIDGIAKLTEKVDILSTENQSLKEELAALKPATESEEDKTAREAKEAEDKAIADKAEADKKLADEAEAKRIEDEKAKDDLAKSGGNDQGGAKGTDDDIDDDTELTPELQAKIDAELEAAVSQ